MMGIFLWEEPDGARKWEAYADWETLKPMMAALLERGADPAKMMMSVELRWMCPIKHKGRKTVWIDDIRDICNRNVVSSASSAPDTPVPQHDEGETGWISPDGRFFPCGYGCHTEKAREIIGLLKPVNDPRWYLEVKGWLAIYKNPVVGKSLAIGMAREFSRISDQQLQTLRDLGLEEKIENLSSFL